MLEKQISHISPLPVGKAVTGVIFLLTLVVFTFELFFRVDEPVIGTSILLVVLLPVIYSIVAGLLSIAVCVFYNMIASKGGGIVVTISSKD